ncbi:MAG: creatininase family protein [Haloferacaceae archaeon]
MDLASATWTDVRETDADAAVLPVGSTEQHGPHAPLGTDVFHAESVAAAGAEAHDADVLVAPPVPVGVAEEHRAFDGTLWVSPGTLRDYVRETVTSLAGVVEAVVVVNGHGGNVAALRETTARVTRDGDCYAVPFTWFDAVDPGAAAREAGVEEVSMGHGGPVETALLRHTHPDLVHEDRAERARDEGASRWGEWVAGVNLAYDTEAFSESGAVGDPTAGSAEMGAALLTAAGAALDEVLTAATRRAGER